MGSRKFVALLLTVIIAFSMIPTGSLAAGEDLILTVESDKATVTAGETVIVTFAVTEANAGYAALTFVVEYDSNLFDFVKATTTNLTGMNGDYDSDTKKYIGFASDDITSTGTIVTAAFTAKAISGTGSFNISVSSCKNDILEALTTSVTPATVSVNVPATGLSLSPTSLTLEKGASNTVQAVLDPANSNAVITFAVDDPSLVTATSSDSGKNITVTAAADRSGITTLRATATNPDSSTHTASCTITVNLGVNSATLSISPTSAAKYGDTLTATVTNLSSNTDVITYQWYRITNGTPTAISGANSNTYTVVAADVGNSVTVKASITNASSIPYSNSPLTTGNVAISKASQTAPTVTTSTVAAEQVILSATGGSAVGAVEYGYAPIQVPPATEPNSATQTNSTITGLTENTSYTFFARYAGDASTEASPWGSVNATTLYQSRTVAVEKFPDASQIAVGASTTTNVHTGDSVTVTTTNASPTNYKFKEWKEANNNVATSSNETYTFAMPANDVSLTAYYYTIETTPTAPIGSGTLTDEHKPAVKYTTEAGNYYAVTNSTAEPATGWVLAESSAATVTEVATHGGTYYIHTYKPASDAETRWRSAATHSNAITTPHYYAWTANPAALSFTARTGGAVPAGKTVTITNVGSTNISGVSVALTGGGADKFDAQTIDTSIAKDGTVTFTVTPKSGSTATVGTYAATATVAGASMTSIEVPITYTVSDKMVVYIAGTFTTEHEYNRGAITPITGVSATYTDTEDGQVKNFDTGNLVYTTYTGEGYGTALPGAPFAAGSYKLVITVNEASGADYIVDTATGGIEYKITPRPLTVTGLSVTTKTYDRSASATITGTAVLNNKIDNDDVSISTLTAGTFTNADGAPDYNVGMDKPVTFTDLTLSGGDASNYTLTQPTLTGNITAKVITPIATASDKVYDGNTSATVSVTFNTNDICAGDTVTLSHAGQATFDNKNAATNKLVTLGTVTASGTNAGNYDIKISNITAPHATITQLERSVALSGTPTQVYDGQPADAFTGTYTVATNSNDTAAVTVYYKLSGTDAPTITVPTLAGTYTVSASITDANYKLGTTTGQTQLVISAGELGGSNIDVGVASLQSSVVKVPVSSFGITPAVSGTYAVTASTTANGILKVNPTAPQVVGTNVEFYINPGATTTNADTISVTFTPAAQNTYAAKTLIINVKRATENATAAFTPYILYVNLGDSVIDACTNAGINFNVTYASHTSANKSIAPASWTSAPCEYSTTYDPAATGTNAIGAKTLCVTYTDAAGNKWSGQMSFTVNDVVTAIEVTSPTQVEYNIGATAFNFTGGSYKKIMKSQVEDANPTAITQAMCSVNGAALTASILNKIGTYTVSVTDASSLKSDSFTITVKAAKQDNITTSPTNDNPVGVIDVAATFTNLGGNVTPSDISLDITSAVNPEASLTNALSAKLGSSMRGDTLTTMHLSLKAGSNPVGMSGKVRVRVPVPAGAQSSDTFAVVIMDAAGNATTVVPTRVGNFLEFELTSNNVDIAIASRPYQGGTGFNYYITYTYEDWLRDNQYDQMAPPSGLEPDVKQSGYDKYTSDIITAYGSQQSSFWEVVRNSIKSSPAGTVIRANAKTFDQMPADIMNLIRANSVTLVLGWSWGQDITITPNNALVPEAERVYYPLSFLVTALSAATTTTAASVLLVPQTGDALEVLSMTPAACGMLDGAKPSVGNAVAALDIAVQDTAISKFPYLPVALGALAAALLLAGLAVGKRRRKGAK